MIKIKIFVLLIFPKLVFSQAQLFKGKLTYVWIPSKIEYSSIYLNQKMVTFRKDTINREVIIRDSLCIEKRSFQDGILSSILEQVGSDLHVLDLNNLKKKIYHPYLATKMHDIVSREKTKETKFILGLLCRKYIYVINGTKIMAWIPNNSPYLKQRDYGENFDIYFFPDGLAFEIESILLSDIDKAGKHGTLIKLVKMELFDATKEDFDKFLDEACKQPLDMQLNKF